MKQFDQQPAVPAIAWIPASRIKFKIINISDSESMREKIGREGDRRNRQHR